MEAVVTPVGIAQIVGRNSAPIVGILFFHWSTTNVLVLYLLDTILSFGLIFADLAKSFAPAKPDQAGARVGGTCSGHAELRPMGAGTTGKRAR